jgi:uncharacterized membrane protein YphA (DoxX/SURF4 family)
MQSIYHKLDEWIFSSFHISRKSLSLYRILFVLSTLILTGIPDYTWISQNPDYFFNPRVSVALAFTGFPSYWFLQFLTIMVWTLYAFVLFGFRTRISSILLSVFLIIGNSFTYAFGKVDHYILIELIPLVLSFSNWGSMYSIDSLTHERPKSESWPITLLALLLAFGMFTAGIPKLMGGWLLFDTHAVQMNNIQMFHYLDRSKLLSGFFIKFKNDFFWESLDYLAVFFELSFLFTVLNRKLFRVYLMIAILFHCGNLLILNISFSKHFILYLLFIDWQPVENWILKFNLDNKLNFLQRKRNILLYLFVSLFFLTLAQHSDGLHVYPSIFKYIVSLTSIDPILAEGVVSHFCGFFGVVLAGIIWSKSTKGEKGVIQDSIKHPTVLINKI